ncbi:PREDICTED: uncharacterized protein LOC109474296 [Branchiostoma belcheri]|uniref:Uncharacterized protein LOC109474296 n=1 Tax=Branchiostoma belcheri TaxID=7741 RepID=A0A6P4ZGE0_BRABE|nr:PREDICTED: uncharacterized protein LOC109474296 [Branchiostoma belcheri]
MLSAKGKVTECRQTIGKLLKAKTDPDFQVSLRHGASQNAINAGNLEEASRLLREIESILPETSHETEHRLRWYHQKSFLKLRARKYDMGLLWVQEAIPLIETVAPGCITGWLLVNHAWFLTEIAAGQDDEEDRRFLIKKAETDYQHAIEHAEREDPKQMLHFQSRLPQFAKIGLALMYLGCRESCDNSRLGIISKDVSLEDIRKAKNVIASLDKEGMLCNISKFLLKVVKSCLLYRQGSYQQAYDLALEARDFATKHSFGGFANFANSIVNYLQDYV